MSFGTIANGPNALGMSDNRAWRKCTTAEDENRRIEAYLCRKLWATDLKVSLRSLLDDAETQESPTSEWYALHYIVEGDDKWNQDLIAWGLNIAQSDLSRIRREVVHLFTTQTNMASYELDLSMPDVATTGSRGIAYVFDEAIEKVEALYSTMRSKAAAVRVPRFWRESALHALALSCSVTARRKHELSYRPKCATSPLPLTLKPSGRNTTSHASLDFDCVNRIFSMSGLKLGTMRALARVWGFSDAEIDSLIKHRCNPNPLLAKLVADPEQLRNMMHDCDVVLTGSRAAGFFWPSASIVDSEWRFITHPHVSHWLKFAAYLVSIGAKFELPARMEDSPSTGASDMSSFRQEHHSVVEVLRGTIWHRGRRQRLQLAAHREHPRQQSSIQEVLQLHSSIAQCLITGFGAVCMYAQQTTTGQSHAWSVGDFRDSAPRVRAQRQVDKYIDRGIDYIPPSSHAALVPGRIPEPKLRKLGDGGALCISFERYVSDDNAGIVRSDFALLREVSWWEECHGLKAVQQAGGSFWSLSLEDSWADRAISRAARSPTVPLFDSMMERLHCKLCQINVETLCSAHVFDDSEMSSAELLFFCLRHVERRRVSWSFLGLDFRWDECWEYPYV